MNVTMFGHRCLVEFHRIKTNSMLVIPDAAQAHDTHRLGIVRFIGDGRVKGSATLKPALVKVGDMVLFQINQIMEATQTFKLDGKTCMNLLQEEIIARVHGDDLGVDNLEMLGDYALLKHFVRQAENSLLVLPDNLSKEAAPDFIYFKLLKKGAGVDLPVELGQELVVNYGRLTPMFVQTVDPDTQVTKNEEYCYTRKDWIDGVVTA